MVHRALELIRTLPRSKVTTYGELARVCETSPRAIGSIMRTNKHPEFYPCFKVVCADGRIGGYSGDCPKEEKLEEEGLTVVDGKIVDFRKMCFKF